MDVRAYWARPLGYYCGNFAKVGKFKAPVDGQGVPVGMYDAPLGGYMIRLSM